MEGGMMTGQIVEVRLYHNLGPYAYVWDGDTPLNVGDRVAVPGPPWAPRRYEVQSVGVVVKFGSDYPGPLEAIIEKVSS
jgi:hypothetical protein